MFRTLMNGNCSRGPIPKRLTGHKRFTDPFQVFCTDSRPDVAAKNPTETVGGITAILSAMWRSMTTEQKMVYVECARRFDRIQEARSLNPRPPPTCGHPPLAVPLIHVVRRGDSSQAVEMASMHSLTIGDEIQALVA
jgi:hypothetical protein